MKQLKLSGWLVVNGVEVTKHEKFKDACLELLNTRDNVSAFVCAEENGTPSNKHIARSVCFAIAHDLGWIGGSTHGEWNHGGWNVVVAMGDDKHCDTIQDVMKTFYKNIMSMNGLSWQVLNEAYWAEYCGCPIFFQDVKDICGENNVDFRCE